ncbi:unnamed protein product [Amoebophrya sp. A25]|nr:unnamed protein product [Amoebophrya sp. A25]|eukprot:GSA25T00006558001.1
MSSRMPDLDLFGPSPAAPAVTSKEASNPLLSNGGGPNTSAASISTNLLEPSTSTGASSSCAAVDDSAPKLYDNLKQLIKVVDDLRDVGLQQYIDLPRIVAIGSQSSGKSSVIESIAGYDFLPRGDGLCTRRPLELRMKHLNPADYPGEVAYAIFERTKKKFTNFDQVREEIERETDMIAGKNKAIVDDPIKLEIHATNAPDLTLIDLPGITLVPMKGSDQNEDIEKITKDMTNRYIQNQKTIILAVLPANQDVVNADSLQMAKAADPQGLRTIGVITKIDIMDRGTDAVKMLQGADVPLMLGYVGVKLRSQQDIRDKKKIKAALLTEKQWFAEHPRYSRLPPGMTGIPTLIEKLTKILFKHIRHVLPDIKSEIQSRMRTVSARLEELGEGVPLDEKEQVQLVWGLINDYTECFKSTIRGRYDRKLHRYISALLEINGGAQIRTIFNEFLIDFHMESITDALDDHEIDRAIRMHEGDSLPGFGNMESFEYLLRPHLQKVKLPASECVSDVSAALDNICQKIAKSVFRRFPKLADLVLQKSQDICYNEKQKAMDVVEHLVSAEIVYRFTNDDEYLVEFAQMGTMYQKGGQTVDTQNATLSAADAQANQDEMEERLARAGAFAAQKASDLRDGVSKFFQDPNEKRMFRNVGNNNGMLYNKTHIDHLRRQLDCFFSLSIRNWRDSIPKAIGYFLVRALEDKMQFELFVGLTQQNQKNLTEMLGEPPHITDERRSLAAQEKTLKKAADILQKDPQIASLALEGGLASGSGGGPTTSSSGGGVGGQQLPGGGAGRGGGPGGNMMPGGGMPGSGMGGMPGGPPSGPNFNPHARPGPPGGGAIPQPQQPARAGGRSLFDEGLPQGGGGARGGRSLFG